MSVASSPPAFDFSSRSSDFASVPGTPSTPTTALPSEAGDASKDHEQEDSHEMELEDDEPRLIMLEEEKVTPIETDAGKNLQLLNFLVQKSTVYATIIGQRIEEQRVARAKQEERAKKSAAKGKAAATATTSAAGKKRKRVGDEILNVDKSEVDAMAANKRARLENDDAVHETPQGGDGGDKEEEKEEYQAQSPVITGATLRDYQLAGVQWLSTLHANGLNGILGDEMGLGKTLQTIAFLAHLRDLGIWGPFLIVSPLSVLHNWITEFAKFAPSIPVCMYHGTQEERAELRRTVLRPPVLDGNAARPRKPLRGRGRKSVGGKKKKIDEEEEEEPLTDLEPMEFPIVCTTYDMIIRDTQYLANLVPNRSWQFIVVDEGHRLKNMDCRLMKEIKSYPSEHRLLLTGTPLHNSLAELWSLLNFILPSLFNDLASFESWFNLPELTQSTLSNDQSTNIITSLHQILKPFLLRRLKSDVETSLPPKKEYILYAPLTKRQKDLYDLTVKGGLRKYLIQQGMKTEDPEDPKEEEEDGDAPRTRASKASSSKSKKRQSRYEEAFEDDDDYFARLADGKNDNGDKGAKALGHEHRLKLAMKKVNNMHLQNVVMQLRKVCSHPYLFDWPLDENNQYALDDQLVNASGKMLFLNRLLDELFKRKHKVLVFSQFTTMLDIMEDWAVEFKGWNICRIDGKTSPLDRRSEMERFNAGGDDPEAPNLFLLSTRSGGLGINLVAADTVIFYDQDWNPQMDLQAQDRAHRIGQTRPVLIFRLVSQHTIEESVLQRASEKRKLEALIIAKGKFRNPAAATGRGKETMRELAQQLLELEAEKINVVSQNDQIISDASLDALLDRRPEVFESRHTGWTSKNTNGKTAKSKGVDATFEVYEQKVDEASEGLAKLMGEGDIDT